MSATADQDAWVTRVLNVAFPTGGRSTAAADDGPAGPATPDPHADEPGDAAWDTARTAWTAACDAATAAAKSYQDELAETNRMDALGFASILTSYAQELDAALQVETAAPVKDTIGHLAALRAEMTSDTLLSYLDSNGVKVQAAFLAGLSRVQAILQS